MIVNENLNRNIAKRKLYMQRQQLRRTFGMRKSPLPNKVFEYAVLDNSHIKIRITAS